MTGPFTKIYPTTGDGIVTCDGGLNSRYPVSTIQDNESPDCLNVVFEDGAVKTREGTSLLNTAAIGSFVGDGLYTRRAQNNTQTMIALAGGTAWDLQGTSFITIGSAQSVFTAAIRVGSFESEDHIFFGNGGQVPYKWSGADWTRHGVYPPTTTATAGTNSNGTLTGDYRYKVVFVSSQVVESDVGPATATFTAASEEILVSSIPVAPQSFGIDSRRIYRTSANASTYYLVGTINDNTTTTFIDNNDDAELGAAAPTDQGVPPLWNFCDFFQDRAWVNDTGSPNFAWYSEAGNPYVFKSTNFFRVGDETGKLLRGIRAYNNGIMLAHDEGYEFIYMPDTTPSNWIKISLEGRVNFGTLSPYAMINFQDRLLFPAMRNRKIEGVGSIVGSTTEPDQAVLSVLTAGGELISQKIEDKMFDLEEGQEKSFTAIEFKNKIYFTVTQTDSATANDRIYVLNYNIDNLSKVQKFSWSLWDGLNAADFTVYNGNLYYLDGVSGSVYKMLDGTYNDNGNAINSYYWTKEFPGFKGDENFQKDFRFLNVLAENSGSWSMWIYARVNSDVGDGDRYTADLTPNTSLWGTAVMGTDLWGGGTNQIDIKQFLGGIRGKRVQFKFTNQNVANQSFKIHWLKYAYNKKGYR